MMRSAMLSVLAVTVWTGCSSDSGPDTTPPTVASVNPANGATGVAITADVLVNFSEAVDPATVTPASVALQLGSFVVPVTRTLENGNRVVRLHPTSGLGNNSTYALSVSGAVTDAANNPLSGAPVNAGFTTATASATVNDGTGDTYGVGGVQHDLTTFSSQQGSITFVLQFAAAIARASAGLANSVGGYVDIDADQNGATGVQAFTDGFRPDAGSTGLGIEYVVYLFDNPDGSLSVFDNQLNELGTVMPTFGATSISFTVPLSLLGDDDGNVDLATVIGTNAEPTDIAPNSGHLTLGVSGRPAAAPAASQQRAGAAPSVHRWGQ